MSKTPLTDAEEFFPQAEVNPQCVRVEFARKLESAIRSAIETANGRESEWGERAQAAFEHLRQALR